MRLVANKHRLPGGYALLSLAVAGLVACEAGVGQTGPSGSIARSGTPKPAASGTPVPGSPGASASPKASGDPSKVGGGVEKSAPPSTAVRFVTVEPADISLNVPSADGTNPAGFASFLTLSAVAAISGGGTASADVTWTVGDATRLTVDAAGKVSVKAGAATGSAVVFAESRVSPGVKGVATVTVTADGLLRISGLPTETPAPMSLDVAEVIVKKNGIQVAGGPAVGARDYRIGAGSGYRILVNRRVATDSVNAPGAVDGFFLYAAIADPVTVPPGAIATVSVTLQATNSLPQ